VGLALQAVNSFGIKAIGDVIIILEKSAMEMVLETIIVGLVKSTDTSAVYTRWKQVWHLLEIIVYCCKAQNFERVHPGRSKDQQVWNDSADFHAHFTTLDQVNFSLEPTC